MRTIICDTSNMVYRIGENAIDNWNLLEQVSGDDIFFHLSKLPSCYVIMETGGKCLSIDMYETGAYMCRGYTKYKNLRNIVVDYCKCSNVEKGENVGEVIYKSRRQVKRIKLV